MRQQVRIVAHRNASGKISVRLRCLIGGKYCDVATGISIQPSEWNKRRLRVTTSHPDNKQINAQLDNLFDAASLYLDANPNTTVAALRAAISDKKKTVDTYTTDDLFQSLDAFISTEGKRNTWSDGTVRRFRSLGASLSAYCPVLHLSTLSASTLDRYIQFRADNGFNNTTIGKDIKLLRWFLRWCADNGRYDGTLHDTYTPHLKGSNYEYKEVLYLTLDELRTIEDAELPQYLANVRDLFVFCCFTGLRYSDASALLRTDIHDGYIETVTRKTRSRLRIELNRHAAAILDRHKNFDYIGGRALPPLSMQYVNESLKRIGQQCGIDEPTHIVTYSGNRRNEKTVPKYELLTSHCARRTFVVTALQLGIPLEVISRWTGHTDLKALKPYVAIVDDLKARNMAKFDTL